MRPRAFILAGPNGAGKTTFAREFLAAEGHCPTFLNADLIAAGLSPLKPELAATRAMQVLLHRIQECVAAREDFAIESTLAGRSYLVHMNRWIKAGYHLSITFLSLPSVELAKRRVAQRVVQGGHDIPSDVIERRFHRGWANFQDLYRPLAHSWQVYDASGWPPRLLEEGPHHDAP